MENSTYSSKLTAICYLGNKGIINIQTFDDITKVWSTVKKITLLKKQINAAIIVIEEKLIIVGGEINNKVTNSVECLDLRTFMWTSLTPMRQSRTNCQTANVNGNLYVFSDSEDSSLEIYNFTTREWRDLQTPSKPEWNSRITSYNGNLYVADLKNGILQSLDVSSNQWTLKTISEKRSLFGFAAVDRFLYIIGGLCNDTHETLNSVQRYNLSNDSISWSEMARLPESRHSMKTVVLGTKIVICSGLPNPELVQEYDMNTNTWKTFSSKLVNSTPLNASLVHVFVTDLF